MTPLQKKILDLEAFYCRFEMDEDNKCIHKTQCPECKALEDTCKQDFSEDET